MWKLERRHEHRGLRVGFWECEDVVVRSGSERVRFKEVSVIKCRISLIAELRNGDCVVSIA